MARRKVGRCESRAVVLDLDQKLVAHDTGGQPNRGAPRSSGDGVLDGILDESLNTHGRDEYGLGVGRYV